MIIRADSKKLISNSCLEVRELLMVPGGGEKGEGELVHGQGQPVKGTPQGVGRVLLTTRGDLYVFRVGQHKRGQEVATHLMMQYLNVTKKNDSIYDKNLLSFAAAHNSGEELELSLIAH